MFVQRRDMGEKFRDLLRYLPQEFGYTPGFTAKDFMLSKIIETVWKRYDGEYYVVNDSKVNVHGYRKKYLFDKEMQ